MKATLTFDLPDEKDDFNLANNGRNYLSSLWDLDEYLRGCHKHKSFPKDVKTPGDMAWHIRQKMAMIMEEKNVSLDEMN